MKAAGGAGNRPCGARGLAPNTKRREYAGQWDDETPDRATFDLILGMAEHAIIFGGNYFTDSLPQQNGWFVWDKQNSLPTMSDCELAWTNLPRNNVKRFTYRQSGMMSKETERFHPTQKPVQVMEWALGWLPRETKTVLDPFAGSGSTGVACVKMGVGFIGIEREKVYFDAMCKRIADAEARPDMFLADRATAAHRVKHDKGETLL